MKKAPKPEIPPEAAQIMSRLVRMPPKPHDEMKVGKGKLRKPKEVDTMPGVKKPTT